MNERHGLHGVWEVVHEAQSILSLRPMDVQSEKRVVFIK
jgi:hypothetical protein